MKYKLCFCLTFVTIFVAGVFTESGSQQKDDQILYNVHKQNNKFDSHSGNIYETPQQTDSKYRQKRTVDELYEVPDNIYEFFQRKPLPNNTPLEKLPPWALQQLLWLIQIFQHCAPLAESTTLPPRRGRRAPDDEQERIEFTPRMGKKSVPFKPRLGRRSFYDEN